MPSRPRRRLKEYRGPDGLLAHPGEPAPNGADGKSVAAAEWTDFAPIIRALAKMLYEGWRDESGEQRRFIAMPRQTWPTMDRADRVLFCRMAERALAFCVQWRDLPREEKRRVVLEAYVGD